MKLNSILKTSLVAATLTWSLLPGSKALCHDSGMEAAEGSQAASFFQILDERVTLSALVELEYFAQEGYGGTNESDLSLATVELGMEAELSDWVSANLLLLWEEGESFTVDEAVISIGNPEQNPLFFNGGRMYVPYGFFETNMIQDPLTLSLGETGETAVEVGFEMTGVQVSAYAFRGDVKEVGADDEINSYGVTAGYVYESDSVTVDLGLDWINNMSVAGDMPDYVPEEINSYVAGMGAHAMVTCGSMTTIVEYISALDEYDPAELAFQGEGAQPSAWNLEAALTTAMMDKEVTFAAGYQQTSEGIALELPESRYLFAIGMEIFDYTSLKLEYLHDEDYSITDGGSGDSADQISALLAVEF